MKKYSKILLMIAIFLVFSLIFSMVGCKKKREWHVLGEATVSTPVSFGVHPERGSDSEAVQVYNAIIYYPLGRDGNGESQYNKIMYELEELTPQNLDTAFKDLGIIASDCLYYDFVIEDSDTILSAGPGAPVGSVLNKVGTVYYVDELEGRELYSELCNDAEYEDKTVEQQKGMIDMQDVIGGILKTFEENYQLVECGYVPANTNDYIKKYGSLPNNK